MIDMEQGGVIAAIERSEAVALIQSASRSGEERYILNTTASEIVMPEPLSPGSTAGSAVPVPAKAKDLAEKVITAAKTVSAIKKEMAELVKGKEGKFFLKLEEEEQNPERVDRTPPEAPRIRKLKPDSLLEQPWSTTDRQRRRGHFQE
ncbi:hypothetical protein VMCG_07058 [Cytospora schulzeri]|uniref:Uncharacterized protein n=1 Tax=Cytospora schulzeri TaxID=448051 RepID=A0A423W3X6_9PEZI|nr:hypothetical protein VMCG_07058 [Valsa malicola]